MKISTALLPDHLQSSHELCLFLHDELLYSVQGGEAADGFSIELSMESVTELEEIGALTGEALWSWLEEHGHTEVTDALTMALGFRAVVVDLCLFLLEALRASEQRKMTVAFSLLRKPLTEHLYYLEWLLSDPEEFVATMKSGSASDLALNTGLNSGAVLRRIQAALSLSEWAPSLDSDWLFAMRYSKDPPYQLQKLFHQSLHLVTRHKKLTTTPQNLNLIFSDQEAQEDQREYLYSYLPLLIDYAFSIVRLFAAALRGQDLHADEGRDLRRLCGWSLAREDFRERDRQYSQEIDLRGEQHSNLVPKIRCPNCDCGS